MSEVQEIDEEKEFIKNILLRTPEESFITSNYILIEESSLNFSCEEISEADFEKVLKEMKETISKVQDGYESAYMNLDRWTLEISTGDRMFREGLKEWEEGLDDLFEYCKDRNEEYINSGIKKIYEGNKKLIINQKIEEYVDEQVKMLQKKDKEGKIISTKSEKGSSKNTEKPAMALTVIPIAGYGPLISKKEEKLEEKLPSNTPEPVTSIKILEKKPAWKTDSEKSKLPEEKPASEKITPLIDHKPSVKISEKSELPEKKTAAETVIPGTEHISSIDVQEKNEYVCRENLNLSEKETSQPASDEKEQAETERSDKTDGEDKKEEDKTIRKPADLSKRVRKSSHVESKISDLSSDNDREKKSIRRPAGLSRKAGKKKEN